MEKLPIEERKFRELGEEDDFENDEDDKFLKDFFESSD